jgi:hypothetical protein
MADLSDYLNSINFSKQSLMEDLSTLEENEKGYLPYVVNRLLSNFPDSIFPANQMNIHSHLDKRMQYDFLLHTLRSRKRFSKFQKPEEIENLQNVKDYFGYSERKAREALRILTPENLEYIKQKLYVGGRAAKK